MFRLKHVCFLFLGFGLLILLLCYRISFCYHKACLGELRIIWLILIRTSSWMYSWNVYWTLSLRFQRHLKLLLILALFPQICNSLRRHKILYKKLLLWLFLKLNTFHQTSLQRSSSITLSSCGRFCFSFLIWLPKVEIIWRSKSCATWSPHTNDPFRGCLL
jgi:hypothetical protein